jgi:hypothetical protein
MAPLANLDEAMADGTFAEIRAKYFEFEVN